jgi:hypothetical protein
MLMGGTVSSVRAEAEIATIHLLNGGTIRGEIVVDVPGAPLTVMVAGQAMQITRETIASVERPMASTSAAAPGPAPVAAQPAPIAPPVYGQPPVYAPAAAPAPIASVAGPYALAVDRRGRAAVDPTWSPAVQQLVLQRNDVAYTMKRKGLGSPIMMMSFGAIGVITTAVATTIVYNNYAECVGRTSASSFSYGSCDNTAPVGMGVGYGFGSALLAGGATFLVVRILKRKALQRRLALIDQDLRRFNVGPIAKLGAGGGMGGVSLRASF